VPSPKVSFVLDVYDEAVFVVVVSPLGGWRVLGTLLYEGGGSERGSYLSWGKRLGDLPVLAWKRNLLYGGKGSGGPICSLERDWGDLPVLGWRRNLLYGGAEARGPTYPGERVWGTCLSWGGG
jgi:hypothetical protein